MRYLIVLTLFLWVVMFFVIDYFVDRDIKKEAEKRQLQAVKGRL